MNLYELKDYAHLELREHPKRWAHTLGVIKMAKRLARHYHVSTENAVIAGLLHDTAKYMPLEEQKKLILEIHPDADLSHWVAPTLHAYTASVNAELIGLDEDIVNAIRYHATGRPNMSLLEKIIYISDYAEITRPFADQTKEIRRLAYQDLDAALLLSMNQIYAHLKKDEHELNPLTEDAYAFYQNKER